MRAWAFLMILLASGCPVEVGPAPADVCAEATLRFNDCGANLPFISDGPCAGLRETLAQCVVDQGESCDALAALAARPDRCLSAVFQPPTGQDTPTQPLFPGPGGP
ncbi:MAG: hypothetical protein U1E65_21395 [Myxococcota bacterium]